MELISGGKVLETLVRGKLTLRSLPPEVHLFISSCGRRFQPDVTCAFDIVFEKKADPRSHFVGYFETRAHRRFV